MLLATITWIVQCPEKLEAILYRSLSGFQQGNFFGCTETHIRSRLKTDAISVGIQRSGAVLAELVKGQRLGRCRCTAGKQGGRRKGQGNDGFFHLRSPDRM